MRMGVSRGCADTPAGAVASSSVSTRGNRSSAMAAGRWWGSA
jgi:hypothetical protein